jgi:DNA polymerase-3 subunit alpha
MKFKCGCEFDSLDFSNIPLDCPATWDLIGSGFTKGVFQLEGNLGKKFAKEIEPRNIEELSDVISLIRPGCLEAEYREDPKKPEKMLSITWSYIKAKKGEIQPEYVHESLEPIFKSTYGVPVYQEQIMRICTDFAGFSLREADSTRKAVGKKIPELMIKVGEDFVNSAIKIGRDEKVARFIFSWIDKFSGYSFNKSHGVSYAMTSYRTAYAKRHFPTQFFKAMLTYSDSKQDSLEEIQELVHEAKLFDIKVKPPCLSALNRDFYIQNDNSITFGLSHIKGVGKSAFASLKKLAKAGTYQEVIQKSFDGKKTNKSVMEGLIKSGAMDHLGQRIEILEMYKIAQYLTGRERTYFFEITKDGVMEVSEAVPALIESKIPNKPRRAKIHDRYIEIKRELGGSPKKMSIGYEKYYLGVPLSGSPVDLYNNPKVDVHCKNIHKMANKSYGNLGVIIEDIRKIKDKNDNWMCFLKVSDNTYMTDGVVVFSRQYNNYAWILEEGKPVLISGRKDSTSFIVNSIGHL